LTGIWADHYVLDEIALASGLHEAVNLSNRDLQGLVLVGIEPDTPDPELDYIVPGRMSGDRFYTIRRFVDKPLPSLASELLSCGALWNSCIFAGNGASLLGMLRQRIASIVEEMASEFAGDDGSQLVAGLYQRLESVDFTRAITQGTERSLRVVAAPPCGWTDLGTPTRVADTLRRLDRLASRSRLTEAASMPSVRASALVDLAAQHARLRRPQ
jgi:mannose-1-phosphate guanylyltransferase